MKNDANSKNHLNTTPFVTSKSYGLNIIGALILCIGLFQSNPLFADNLRLVDKPLVDSTQSDVLPNLMYVLDNSGSMAWNFTPDWVRDYDTFVNNTNITFTNPILTKNAEFNTQYYNPSIRYTPAVNFTGVSRGEQTNFSSVKNDNFNVQSTASSDLRNSAEYYSFIAGEYCTDASLKSCVARTTPLAPNVFPATIRWCNSQANAIATNPAANSCQSVRVGNFTNLRAPLYTRTITVDAISNNGELTLSIFANSTTNNILSAPAEGKGSNNSARTNAATDLRNKINGCTTAFCKGVSATSSGAVVTITSIYNINGSNLRPVRTAGTFTTLLGNDSAKTPGEAIYVSISAGTTSIYSEPGKNTAASDRTDCTGTGGRCTGNQEMTNYANWWTYYRTRMQGMKTSTSLAFSAIDNRYRVGFITINDVNNNYLPINKFETGNDSQKDNWYKYLFATVPSGGTPLRQALATVGRIYAAKAGGPDPVEYACQPNFTLLTTDGYWNGAAGTTVTGTAVGNLDGTGTPSPLYEGKNSTSTGSLADVAKYYYDTDLRSSQFQNCTGAIGQLVCGEGVGNENISKQNMTTLTLGLGIDGTLLFDSDYKNQAAGDFADIRAGTKPWPIPVADTATAIDDLWHAAVNSNGTYFSARNPRELSESLRRALSDIQSVVGAGSAAAASSLQPTEGDNFDYLASYATVKWTGNLEARKVQLGSLITDTKATWCVEDIPASSCVAPAQLASENGAFFCKTTNSNTDSCENLGGKLSGTECRVGVINACNGTLKSKVTATNDTRDIKMIKNGTLVRFDFDNMTPAQKSFYSETQLANKLSQWSDLTATQKTKAFGANLVNYLRGQQQFENRSNNLTPENKVFRAREATLGDITESQPAYVSAPRFSYVDAGYAAYKAAQANRDPTVYVGANDGMLHAFDGLGTELGGQERWAFVPTPVINKMWKLADRDYATKHVNLFNGDPLIADIFDGSWKTILVSGLSGGGRGYFALDITDPEDPKLLWEITDATFKNLGYSYGQPIVTKLKQGTTETWVAMFTSGYNNGAKDSDGVTNHVNQGDGKGHLYIVNASTGELIREYNTGVGSEDTPSGLAPIASYTNDLLKNNEALFVIGGDLQGNVWKFNLNSTAAPIRLATLVGPKDGNEGTLVPQPITTIPQFGIVNKVKVAFIGTGKYLEIADLTDNNKQSMYAIKVDGNTELGNPRGSLVRQEISGGPDRVITSFEVDLIAGLGWYVDFPGPGERVNIDSQLDNGVLVAPTIVPASTSCSPGGFGNFNFFNYKTGSGVLPGGVVSEMTNSPIVGFNISYDQQGNPKLKVVESNNPTSRLAKNKDVIGKGGGTPRTTLLKQNCIGCTFGRKYNWRELIPNQ